MGYSWHFLKPLSSRLHSVMYFSLSLCSLEERSEFLPLLAKLEERESLLEEEAWKEWVRLEFGWKWRLGPSGC